MKEVEQLKQRLKGGVMNELQQERLINYFSPIYYVEYEETLPGELFPHIQRFGFYDKRRGKNDALAVFEKITDAKRVIEKCMYTGKEKVIQERA
jgi:hypothetical protein